MAARTQDQNLDSLLDTMANVVGILVVLVAVTQLSVGDAVERIAGRLGADVAVSAEDVERAAARTEEVARAVVAAEGRLEAYSANRARNGMLLEEIRPHVERLEGLAGSDPLSGDAGAEIAERIRLRREEIARLGAEVESRRSRLSGLEALIASVPSETRPKIARLPNPRTPPTGAEQVAVLCRYGRCSVLDLAGMRQMLGRGIRDALGEDRAVVYEDRPWLVNLFAKQQIGSGNFRWSFREQSRAFFADIAWIDVGYGETLGELGRADSAFVRALDALGPSGRYLRFYAWSDSFEAYLEARYVAEQRGWDAGWLPIDAEEEVGINLLGPPRRRVLLD